MVASRRQGRKRGAHLAAVAWSLAVAPGCGLEEVELDVRPAGVGPANAASVLLEERCRIDGRGGFVAVTERADVLPAGGRLAGVGLETDVGTIHVLRGDGPDLIWAARVVGRSSSSMAEAEAARDSVSFGHAFDEAGVAGALLSDTPLGSEICVVALAPPGLEVDVLVDVGAAILDGHDGPFNVRVTAGDARVAPAGPRLPLQSTVVVDAGDVRVDVPTPYDASLSCNVALGSAEVEAPEQFPAILEAPLGGSGELLEGSLGAGGAELLVVVRAGRITLAPGEVRTPP